MSGLEENSKEKKIKELQEKYETKIMAMGEPERRNMLDGGKSRFDKVWEEYREEYNRILQEE